MPIELFETRYGLQVEQYAFHNEPGGEGRYRGGKGVVLDYRVTSPEVFLTYAASRTEARPWPVQEGRTGSTNYAKILRKSGDEERYSMCTMVRAEKGDCIRLVSATGGGFGDPRDRETEALALDIKNGYLTREQAASVFGYS